MAVRGPRRRGTAKGTGWGTKRRAPVVAPETKPKGRPQRLAHLVPGTAQHARRDQRDESALPQDGAVAARGAVLGESGREPSGLLSRQSASAAPARAAAPQCLPDPDWLHHTLTVTGPHTSLNQFRAAASGAGVVAWSCDFDRLQEDWAHLMLAIPPAQRGISVEGVRIVSQQLREVVAERHEHAAEAAAMGANLTCPFDLHALVPVPAAVLRLGPDDPAALAWLWEHWGTTWALRRVEETELTRAEVAALLDGHGAFRCRFWAADWTPWRALAAARERWPGLRFHVAVAYDDAG
jgi:hypothetical protein